MASESAKTHIFEDRALPSEARSFGRGVSVIQAVIQMLQVPLTKNAWNQVTPGDVLRVLLGFCN